MSGIKKIVSERRDKTYLGNELKLTHLITFRYVTFVIHLLCVIINYRNVASFLICYPKTLLVNSCVGNGQSKGTHSLVIYA